MRKYFCIALLLAGCSSVKPFVTLGLGGNLNGTDYWVHPDRSWQCRGTKFVGDVGVESSHQQWYLDKWSAAFRHSSYLDCGGPFNQRPEVTEESWLISKKIGGF